jgi:hypothetical protein
MPPDLMLAAVLCPRSVKALAQANPCSGSRTQLRRFSDKSRSIHRTPATIGSGGERRFEGASYCRPAFRPQRFARRPRKNRPARSEAPDGCRMPPHTRLGARARWVREAVVVEPTDPFQIGKFHVLQRARDPGAHSRAASRSWPWRKTGGAADLAAREALHRRTSGASVSTNA